MNKIKAFALFAGSTALISSCSSTDAPGEPTTNYALPSSLCGTKVNQELYATVLPPGDSIVINDRSRERSDGYTSPVGNCFLQVDGSAALTLHSVPSEDGLGLAGYHDAVTRGLDESEEVESDSGWETKVWTDFAATHVDCSRSDRGYSGIYLSIRLDWLNEEGDYREPLADLITSFAKERASEYPPEACVVEEMNTP
ncbi:hypothetical protein ACFV5N_06935 [Streptomyces sp. NPDC059853]|uniref:hypothetical protein n=1 Tax=unclassified Streptomyces TaxID=2593676 RepID=UPI001319DD5D|nr:hypothetical protein [Streptomyces sp. AA0539]